MTRYQIRPAIQVPEGSRDDLYMDDVVIVDEYTDKILWQNNKAYVSYEDFLGVVTLLSEQASLLQDQEWRIKELERTMDYYRDDLRDLRREVEYK